MSAPTPPPVAIFGDFAFSELLLVAVVALMIFGKRLPEVAVRAAAHVTRLRRSLTQMWREAGIEEELRRVRRDVERDLPDIRDPKKLMRDMGEQYLERVDTGLDDPFADPASDPEPTEPHQPDAQSTPTEEESADPKKATDAGSGDAEDRESA